MLALVAVLPFVATRHFGAIHDDHFLVGPGSLVADPGTGLARLWTADLFGTPEQPTHQSGFWRPLVLLGLRAEFWLTAGRDVPLAWLGHVVTVLLHAAACVTLWRMLLALRLDGATAVLAAALFAVHPVHPETVAWLSSLGDLGGTACAWGATALLLRPGRPLAVTAGAVLLLVAALLGKESTALLVALAAVLPWLAGARLRSALVPPAIALALYGGLRALCFSRGIADEAWTGPVAASVRWWTWLSIVPDLVRLAVWPGPPSPLRLVEAATGWTSPGVLAGAAVLVVLALLTLSAVRRRATAPSFALLLLLGTLALLAPWVRFPVGYPETAAPLYERYLYAAAAAPAVALAWALQPLARRARLTVAVGAGLLLLALGAVTASRAEAWRSDESFARAGLAVSPRSPSLWTHLGVALLEKLRVAQDTAAGQEALAAFERALQIDPEAPLAPLDRFIALGLLGREDEAEEAAARLLQRQPDEPMVLVNVALWHMGHRRWDQAAGLLQQALATGRAPPSAATDLATCLQQLSARASPAPAAPRGG